MELALFASASESALNGAVVRHARLTLPVADVKSVVEELEPVVLFRGVGELCPDREPDILPREYSAYPFGLILGPVSFTAWAGVSSDSFGVKLGDALDG